MTKTTTTTTTYTMLRRLYLSIYTPFLPLTSSLLTAYQTTLTLNSGRAHMHVIMDFG